MNCPKRVNKLDKFDLKTQNTEQKKQNHNMRDAYIILVKNKFF